MLVRACGVWVLLAWAAAARAQETPVRTWTGATGRAVEGRAVARRGDRVQFELRDGSRPWVPLSSLATNDRAFLEAFFPPPTNAPVRAPAASSQTASVAAPAAPSRVGEELPGIPAKPGKISARIPCEASPQFGYYLWLPPDITPDRKWPIMYVLDPGGGKAGTATRYLKGAAFTGTIIAVSAESSNSFELSDQAQLALVADANKRLPIDPLRQYASGFSGGSRSAGRMGDEMSNIPMAGVLCCGAGPGYRELYKLSAKTALYGLCGSNCFNRWDMPRYFDLEPSNHKRLRYFVGKHDWADENLIEAAMIWLQAHYLADNVRTKRALRPECEAFLAQVLAEAERLGDTAPIRSFELTEIATLFTFTSRTLDGLRQRHSALKQSPAVTTELAALRDEENLIARHFTAPFDYRKGADPAASEAARRPAMP